MRVAAFRRRRDPIIREKRSRVRSLQNLGRSGHRRRVGMDAIFDLTGSYTDIFANGLAWNLLNTVIVTSLMLRNRRRRAAAFA